MYDHHGAAKSYQYNDCSQVGEPSLTTYTTNFVAEVGLLSRLIHFGGDITEATINDQYGAQIMLHSPGDERSVGRIEGV
jgi:hypothetical protein